MQGRFSGRTAALYFSTYSSELLKRTGEKSLEL